MLLAPRFKLFHMIYVDSFKLAGPCKKHPKAFDGVLIRGFAYNVESCLLDILKRYCTMAVELTGKKANLSSNEKTPIIFLPIYSKEAPSGGPLAPGPCFLCPHRMNVFSVWPVGQGGPPGICGPDDGLSGVKPISWGRPIYKDNQAMPKFRSDDLKNRAADVDASYEDFILHGLPKKKKDDNPAIRTRRSIRFVEKTIYPRVCQARMPAAY